MRKKRFWAVAILVFLLVVLTPAVLSLEVFQRAAHRALERRLGRTVEFEDLTVSLLPRPGLVGTRLVVHENPAFGAEPFLYAQEMHCYFPVAALWRWELECAQLNLLEPSLNLVRNRDGAWNVGSILREVSGGSAGNAGEHSRPLVTATGGRINFKNETEKFRHALSDVRFRFVPTPEGPWQVQLEATPLRVDFNLPEAGRLRLTGEVTEAGDVSDWQFRLTGGLERSSLASLLALALGEESPVRAGTSWKMEMEGTLEAWTGQGSFSVEGLRREDHRADENLPGWEGEFQVRYGENTDGLVLEEAVARTPGSELHLAGRLQDPLGARSWQLEIRSEKLDLAEWFAQAATLLDFVPEETALAGTAQLSLRIGHDREEWQGELVTAGSVQLQLAGAENPVEIEGFHLRLADQKLELLPVTLRFLSGQTLVAGGDLRLDRKNYPYRTQWSSQGMSIEALEQVAAFLGWHSPAPGLLTGQAAVKLNWSGILIGNTPPRLRGTIELQNAHVQAGGAEDQVSVPQARLVWDRRGVRVDPLEIQFGGSRISVRLERRTEDVRWTADIQAESLNLSSLTELFGAPEQGFLERLFSAEAGRTIPWEKIWLAGNLRIGELEAGPFSLTRVNARAEFRLGRLDLSRVRFRAYRGRFDGSFRADFLEDPPRYRLAGNVRRLRLGDMLGAITESDPPPLSGLLGAEVLLESSGATAEVLWRNLSGGAVGGLQNGTLQPLRLMNALAAASGAATPGVTDETGTRFQSLAGSLQIRDQQVELDGVKLIVGRAALDVNGRVRYDGTLDFELRGQPLLVGRRRPSADIIKIFENTYHLTGTLQNPRIELVPAEEDDQ